MRYFLTLLAALLLFPQITWAEETEQVEPAAAEEVIEEEPSTESTYSPDSCEFTIKFPEAPYTSRRCEDPEKTRCYDLVSYTQVFELSATVNFRVICNPVGESLYKDYSAQVMEATLRAMTKDSVVDEYNSDFREEENYKQASLVGSGKVGRMPTIYIAQLWIGKQSAFSVEAELIGNANDASDKLFSDILKTVGYSGIKELEPPKKTAAPKND